jgi:hypothetical protein
MIIATIGTDEVHNPHRRRHGNNSHQNPTRFEK